MDVLLSSDKPRATSPRLGVNDARLDCLKKSRDAQKECLDHTRALSVAPAKTTSGGWHTGKTNFAG
jgi:hypothetical protein